MKKILIIFMGVCLLCFSGCGKEQKDNEEILASNDEVIIENEEKDEETQNEKQKEIIDEVKEKTVIEEGKNEPVIEDKKEEVSNEKNSGLSQKVEVPKENENGITTLKFKNTNSDEAIRALNGKKVSITGYLSTLSPLNGKFAYLMNMPYQSCPFCVPGTSAITNTLTIVAGENKKIEFTDLPVTVVGTLETGKFEDEFGYQYDVRLNNVTVNKADMDKLSTKVKQYNLLAENGVVANIYNSIMTLDFAVFYEYYEMETPQKVSLDIVNSTKASLNSYNSKGEYNNLVKLMDDLLKLGNNVNSDVDKGDYSKFNDYKNNLQNLFYTFADWMAEGEL